MRWNNNYVKEEISALNFADTNLTVFNHNSMKFLLLDYSELQREAKKKRKKTILASRDSRLLIEFCFI